MNAGASTRLVDSGVFVPEHFIFPQKLSRTRCVSTGVGSHCVLYSADEYNRIDINVVLVSSPSSPVLEDECRSINTLGYTGVFDILFFQKKLSRTQMTRNLFWNSVKFTAKEEV
jgi:hypothetical protein